MEWCEDNDITLNTRNKTKLLDEKNWQKLRDVQEIANLLMSKIGTNEFDDFNLFKDKVDTVLKENSIRLVAAEKNAILNAVSWYDENAAKVIKKVVKFPKDKLDTLLDHLGCTQEELPDFGYYPTGKAIEFITYEMSSDLRDAESIPLTDEIHRYFLAEVKPHVEESVDQS